MKNFTLYILFIFSLVSCKETPKTPVAPPAPTVVETNTDSVAIANTIHGFFKWYDVYVNDPKKQIAFVAKKGKHNVLDTPKLEQYLADIKSSGHVSEELLENDRAYYKACEKLWQKEKGEGISAGMDANKYFCGQDWDVNFWTNSPVKVQSLGSDRAKATLYGKMGDVDSERNFELKKEGDKWLLAKIECDMGIEVPAVASAGTTTADDKLINELAAFYNGSLPCTDCDGIQTMLTLNADAKRTYTLEEEYKGKKSKTVESSGTWTVADGVVTLQSKSGTSKYQVTKDGLVSLNADGSKRDAKTAMKYLLKKVQGE